MYFRYLIGVMLIAQAVVFGTIQNGGFEIPDPNSPAGFVAPLDWQRIAHPLSVYSDDCYAALLSSFEPENRNWKIAAPYREDSFVMLSTGGFAVEPNVVSDSMVAGSRIRQLVYLTPGDTIIGSYFFGTFDYRPFEDYAGIYLELADANNYPDSQTYFRIPQSECNVVIVGSYQSTLHLSPETGGWIPFSYTVEPNQAGPYYLWCEVVDFDDAIYESFYAVDNLRICYGGHAVSDLTEDCDVNLQDFEILSKAWFAECTAIIDPNDPNGPVDPNTPIDPNTIDPNSLPDPNIPCELADINDDLMVDANDLMLFAEDWLRNIIISQ